MSDEFRIFLALLREGTTSRAAKAARCSQPTVVRRIADLEASLGFPLFKRDGKGLVPNEAALELRAAAERMEEAQLQFKDVAAAIGNRRRQSLTLTYLTDFRRQMLPAIREFSESWPSIKLHLNPTNGLVNLLKGEADIAVRGRNISAHADLVVHELPVPGWGLFCAANLPSSERPAAIDEVKGFRLAGISGAPASLPAFMWVEELAAHDEGLMRYESYSALIAAIGSGAVLSVLPVAMGDGEPELDRCFLLPEDFNVPIYLIARRTALRRPPARALFDLIADQFQRQASALTGRPS